MALFSSASAACWRSLAALLDADISLTFVVVLPLIASKTFGIAVVVFSFGADAGDVDDDGEVGNVGAVGDASFAVGEGVLLPWLFADVLLLESDSFENGFCGNSGDVLFVENEA